MQRLFIIILLALLTVSCGQKNTKPAVVKPSAPEQIPSQVPIQLPSGTQLPDNNSPEVKPDSKAVPDYSLLKPAKWEDVDGLLEDDLSGAWSAWLQSCSTLKNKPQWQSACNAAKTLSKPNSASIIEYLTAQFDVYTATNLDGSNTGLVTGYYEPLLQGSRKQSAQYPYPLYKQPNDIVTVELADIYPELKYKRIRGKLVETKQGGKKLIPYMTRAEIEASPSPLAGSEIIWINDIIDVFFLQIQGSGLVNLDNGKQVHVGYADQNGHPYNSIGRLLIERGELTADQASMQGIKNWARNNLDKLRDLLNSNPSYVFFRELPANLPGPLGALGVPITAERSVAIDPKYVPLGAPIFLSATQPNSVKPLKRLMMAQDTGGAIKGGVRADYFWGAGDNAGKQAGAMKQSGKIWVFLPKGFVVPK
ncbi:MULTISPECIES: murein transglycosylase A [Methylotenera]|uniref:murein transglycosylase A n=1 Tax=Methylotenera TaxID=359407 RepID=UPI0003620AB1|nr:MULTISPECIES: MltA domain-containing protein [Methylotenera]